MAQMNQPLPYHSGHNLILLLALAPQRRATLVPPLLGFPRDAILLLAPGEILLLPQQKAPHIALFMIRLTGLYLHSTRMGITGSCDGLPAHFAPTRLSTPRQAAIPHELPWTGEAQQ
jgi:hypothetical protein